MSHESFAETYARLDREFDALRQEGREMHGRVMNTPVNERAAVLEAERQHEAKLDAFHRAHAAVYPLRPDNIDTAEKLVMWLEDEWKTAVRRRQYLLANGRDDLVVPSRFCADWKARSRWPTVSACPIVRRCRH